MPHLQRHDKSLQQVLLLLHSYFLLHPLIRLLQFSMSFHLISGQIDNTRNISRCIFFINCDRCNSSFGYFKLLICSCSSTCTSDYIISAKVLLFWLDITAAPNAATTGVFAFSHAVSRYNAYVPALTAPAQIIFPLFVCESVIAGFPL